MQSHDRFVREIVDIRRWLFTTIYSYTTTASQLANLIKEGESISEQVDRAFNEKGCNDFSLIRRLSTDNIKTCKELALIRSISALEVFIVEAVREVYDVNKSPFLSNSIVEYHLGEILSCTNIADLQNKYIEQTCRHLHSGGFSEIQKFYKKIFEIDFTKFNHQIDGKGYGISFVEQYHQMRHLIVHRLGKIDEQYMKKYNCTETYVKLSEADLATLFEVLLSFSLFIEKKMCKYILTSPPENRVELKIEILLDKASMYFEPTFPIPLQKNQFVPLSSILQSIEFESSGVVVLQLHGTFVHIRRYYKTLLKKASAGEIKVLAYTVLSLAPYTAKVKQFSWDDVEQVIELLPEKPWDKFIHKKIAQQLGWSNNKVSKIIANILTERPIEIRFERRRLTLHINDTYTFSFSIVPHEFHEEIVWQTSNSNIVEVNDGTITAISPGCTDIFARIPGNPNKAICTVTVIK